MPQVEDLRFDQVCFKASHNTYDHGSDLATLLEEEIRWHDASPARGGCRGLEFDIVAQEGNDGYCVKHEGEYQGEGDCLQFSTVLNSLKAWSDISPDHDVIHVSIDIKKGAGTPAQFAEHFDDYVRGNFMESRLYRPGEMLANHATLVDAAEDGGWPTIAGLRRKFVFSLSGSETYKAGYTETSLKERLCFADRNLTDGYDKRKSANRLFVNVSMGLMTTMPYQYYKERKTPGVVLRAYSKYVKKLPWVRSISNRKLWTRCVEKGFNIVATDRIADTDWARVGSAAFVPQARL